MPLNTFKCNYLTPLHSSRFLQGECHPTNHIKASKTTFISLFISFHQQCGSVCSCAFKFY